MIATPVYSGMQPEFVRSRDAAVAQLTGHGVEVALSYVLHDSLLTHARNSAVAQFTEADFDFLMFIDSDMGFAPDAIMQLLATQKHLVCGVAPKKEINWEAVRRAACAGVTAERLAAHSGFFTVNNSAPVTATLKSPVVEVDSAGTGFMLIHRCVFDMLRNDTRKARELDGTELYFFFEEGADDDGRYLSEDHYFCHKWRKAGGQVFINPFIQLTHTGSYTFRGAYQKGLTYD